VARVRVLAAVLWFVVAGGAAWAAAPADTDKRRLKADPVTRYVRFWRAQFMRILLWLVGWPHLLDAFFGARTVRVGTTPSDVVWQGGSARMVRYRRGTTAPAR
jgi:hypothetical protein